MSAFAAPETPSSHVTVTVIAAFPIPIINDFAFSVAPTPIDAIFTVFSFPMMMSPPSALMVALTLVAVAIVWGVVNNLINSKTQSAECVEVFDKVLLNNYYTCYNSSSGEVSVSVELRDITIDGVLVSVYGQSQSSTFEIPSSGYSYVKPYSGSYNDNLTLPSQNSATNGSRRHT